MTGQGRRGPRNQLTAAEMFHLTEYARDHYSVSGLADTDFAEQASKELEFSVCSANVSTARGVLGLPSNFKVRAEENKRLAQLPKQERAGTVDTMLILNELAAINKLLVVLSKRMDAYFGPK